MRCRSWLVVMCVLWAAPGFAQPAKSAADAELEARFRADVERASPAAAEAFDQANAAREADRPEEALAGYRRAAELAPGVDHPRRRACGVLARLGHIDEALVECEAALKLAPDSPYNKLAVAERISGRKGSGDADRARRLAREAVVQLPADPMALGMWCTMLMKLEDLAELGSCVNRLLAVDPKGVGANYLGAIYAATRDELGLARHRLEEARRAGLEEEPYRHLLGAIDEAENRGSSGALPVPSTAILWLALWIAVAWIGLLGILLVAGYALSRSTLNAVGRVTAADAGAGVGTPRERRLRGLYKAVLLLCGLYFYLSIPILLITIIIAGCGLLYFFFAVGVIPVKLVLLIGIVVVFTIGAILRSLFIRAGQGSLGHRIELDAHPRLGALLDDVAAAVGTRRVDAVHLTPGTDMAVTERAGLWASLRGKRTERSLIMGVGLFDGMTQLQLRSVLAHEHGHFRNEDTAGGGLALAVRSSLISMIIRLAQSGVAGAFNPVWWFLRAYHRVYLGISQGASRLQEVLADRWAIQAYGTAGFVEGYRHVVTRSVRFDHQFGATIKEVIDGGRPLPNLYRYCPQAGGSSEEELAAAIDQEMTREPSAYDSHPSPRQRIEWATVLAVAREPQPGDGEPIWALFEGREALERAMTTEVRERIYANHGIQIDETGGEGEAKDKAEVKSEGEAKDDAEDKAEAASAR